jgi:hypothetical protein
LKKPRGNYLVHIVSAEIDHKKSDESSLDHTASCEQASWREAELIEQKRQWNEHTKELIDNGLVVACNDIKFVSSHVDTMAAVLKVVRSLGQAPSCACWD